ncbi:Tyrosine recombinase XerD [Klebsiella pneumoniae]|nr:Tyrosine recombinase XerD [Klebsiella pneumoniae]
MPWELPPNEVDGSQGNFRPRATRTNATNDYEAVQARLALHETVATRAYRKAARLILAIVERGRALSSLTTDDAIAYRAFRHPTRERWVPPRPRDSVEWRPFSGGLSARSAAYALTVLSALFRWLIEQRYVLANPFAGVKVRGHALRPALDTARGFTEGEWLLLRAIADGLEWSYGWSEPAAQRLRFMLDFGYATGLRASELVGAVLGNVRLDEHGDHWLHLVGKGGKPVVAPPLYGAGPIRHSVNCHQPGTVESENAPVGSLGKTVMPASPALTFGACCEDSLRKPLRPLRPIIRSPPKSCAVPRLIGCVTSPCVGRELSSPRCDNLRHASIATTSMYLHGDELERAQMRQALALVTSSEESTEFSSYGMTEFSGIPA